MNASANAVKPIAMKNKKKTPKGFLWVDPRASKPTKKKERKKGAQAMCGLR